MKVEIRENGNTEIHIFAPEGPVQNAVLMLMRSALLKGKNIKVVDYTEGTGIPVTRIATDEPVLPAGGPSRIALVLEES